MVSLGFFVRRHCKQVSSGVATDEASGRLSVSLNNVKHADVVCFGATVK
jgi:hypothetical protein